MDEIRHEPAGHKGAYVWRRDGEKLAEMTYSRATERLVIIEHTEVDRSLAGQGAGRKLLDALVDWARRSNTKVVPLCPFARAQFEKDASIRDVLQQRSPPDAN